MLLLFGWYVRATLVHLVHYHHVCFNWIKFGLNSIEVGATTHHRTLGDIQNYHWVDQHRIWNFWSCTMSSSSNSNIGPPHDYEFVKTLVRNLHMTKNVSRPDDHNHNTSRPAAIHKSVAEELMFNRLDGINLHSSVSDIDDSYNEGDDVGRLGEHKYGDRAHGRGQPNTHDLSKKYASPTHHQSNCSLNIPSVVITDANEHEDLFASTQRRFSQLYSGLRRFSTSHTVWNKWNAIFVDSNFYVVKSVTRALERRHLLCRPHKWMPCGSVNQLTVHRPLCLDLHWATVDFESIAVVP